MYKILIIIFSFTIIISQAQCISGDCNLGFGIKKFDDGSLYIGQWWNSSPSGQGTVIWSDGTIYVGQFNKGLYHGDGTCFSSNTLYVGEFHEDIPNGKGTMFLQNGDMIYGTFQEGVIDGYGVYKHSNGLIEEGLWEQGKEIGEVILNRPDYILRGLK
tara:strand:+ start:467 stop:940 length:474 start_codon:yes stop_codon:yes gene_type:complete